MLTLMKWTVVFATFMIAVKTGHAGTGVFKNQGTQAVEYLPTAMVK